MKEWWHVKVLRHRLIVKTELEGWPDDYWTAYLCSCGKTWNKTIRRN